MVYNTNVTLDDFRTFTIKNALALLDKKHVCEH